MTNPRPNPYPGPRPYKTGEKLYGRQRETAELRDLLIAERIVLLVSPSGAGKTSLVQAGLIPELEAEGFRVLPVMRPGLLPDEPAPGASRYALSLLLGLERDLPEGEQTPLAELAALSLGGYLDANLAPPEGEAWHGDVLIFDQFEEALTVDPTDREAKLAFFEQVGQALRDRNRWALFAMREEYVAALDPYLRPLPARFDKGRRYRLELLGPASAREAAQRPPGDQEPPTVFTDAAADKLVDDLRRTQVQQADGSMLEAPGQVIEPVQLQVVCRQIWENLAADDYEIGVDDVESVGDVDQALRDYYARTAARVVAETGVGEQAIREWFGEQLITEGGIRAQVLRGVERSPEGKGGLANEAVRLLEAAYLVRAEQRRGATWYELAHDRLVAPVREDNAAWFEANLSTLQRQAALWEGQDKPDGLLLSGAALAEAEAWAVAQIRPLEPREADLLAESQEARDRVARERRQNRIIRIALAAATALALIAIIAAVFAFVKQGQAQRAEATAVAAKGTAEAEKQRADEQKIIADQRAADAVAAQATAEAEKQRADEQKEIAERQALIARSRQLATQSTSELNVDELELALLLGIESGRVAGTLESFAVIRATIAFPWYNSKVFYTGSNDRVRDVNWSVDGARVLTAGEDGTARVWDAASGAELVTLEGHAGRINEAVWSADGSMALTAGSDGTARVWDATDGEELAKLEGHTEPVWTATWNGNESEILTESADGTARVWDADGGDALMKLGSGEDRVSDPRWSPDGTRILAISDATARIWDATSGVELPPLKAHEGPIATAVWSKDGGKILTAGADGTARLWDAASGAELVKLVGHTKPVSAARWNGDESLVLTASDDRTVRSWDALSGEEVGRLGSEDDPVFDAAWSADGSTVLALVRGGALIGDARTLTGLTNLEGFGGVVWRTQWSPDGSKILTQDITKTAVWDAASGVESAVLHYDPAGGPYAAAWSKDGSEVALAGEDGTVRVWKAGNGGELAVMPGVASADPGYVGDGEATLGGDGRRVLTKSNDGMARIWDAIGGAEITDLGKVASVTWNRSGDRVLTAGMDGMARIWDTADGTELVKLEAGEADHVVEATWSEDESRVLTRGYVGYWIARIWDATNEKKLAEIGDNAHSVWEAAWNGDGSKALIHFDDGAIRAWDAQTGAETTTGEGDRIWGNAKALNRDGTKGLEFSPTNARGGGQWIRIWDTVSGAELAWFTESPHGSVDANGAWITVYDFDSQDALAYPYDTYDTIAEVMWSTDGGKVLTRSDSGIVHIWDVALGAELAIVRDLTSESGDNDAAWSGDGSKVLTAGRDGTARVWDVASGAELLKFAGHTGEVLKAVWSGDESRILTVGEDGTARVWDAATGTELEKLEDPLVALVEARWSRDDSRILTRSEDGTVRTWYSDMGDLLEAMCDRAPRNLTWEEWNRFMEEAYRPTCAGAPIPPDVVSSIQERAKADLLDGQPDKAIAALDQLNGWLRESGQFRAFGVEPKAFLAPVLVDDAPYLASAGKIPEAIAALALASEFDPSLPIEFRTWNDLCRYGALWNQADRVIDACNRAGNLAEANWQQGEFYDSRGLARAMAGDFAGAIEDFEAYLARLKGSNSSQSETEVEQRAAWIAALKAGKNPFDDALLQQLRDE